MANNLEKSKVLFGEVSFCSCGATEAEGHTFSCIMEQQKRRSLIVEVRKNGQTIEVRRINGEYFVFVDEEMKHPHCSAEDAMRALATYIEDGS